jgi:hypothetical protein
VAAYAGFGHALVIDSNLAGGWSYDGVAHTFGGDGWDFVGSYGLTGVGAAWDGGPEFLHHDPRAFRSDARGPSRGAGPDGLRLRRGGALLAVSSCFGGLGIYRMACLLACSYEDGGGCEHRGFHDRLRRAGLGRLFLNPSQIVLHSPA